MSTGDFQTALGRRLRLKLFAKGGRCNACGETMDEYSDHALAPCVVGASAMATSRDERHNDVRDYIHRDVATPAQLSAAIEPNGLVPDTQSLKNHDRPADVYVMSPHACSKVGENKDAAAIDVTVVGASDYAPLAQTTKDAATRSEETKASEWTTRVADVNALLSLDGAPVWVPPFEFRPFGLDTHGALGKEAIAIIRQFAEKRADRSPDVGTPV